MTPQLLQQKIMQARQRFEALQHRTASEGSSRAALLTEAFTELEESLEELFVAQEEISQQNEELLVTQLALDAERQRYQELFAFAPDGYLVTDTEGTIQEANRAAGILLNVLPQFLVGKPLFLYVAKADRKDFYLQLNRLLQKGMPADWTIRLQPRDCGPFDAALTVGLKDATRATNDGAGSGYLSWLIRDITAQTQVVEALQHTHAELADTVQKRTVDLRRSNAALQAEIAQRKDVAEQLRGSESLAATGRMAANIAHEMNNPLAGIQYSFALIKDAIPEAHPHYNFVGRIDREIERMLGIVSQLFTLYRPEHEIPRRFDVAAGLADAIALLESVCHKHEVSIALVTPQEPIWVTLPDGAWQQVVFNILSNAIEASSPGERVRVTLSVVTTGVQITVADKGPGILGDIQRHIFEPFFSTKQGYARGGLGLGLPIAKRLIEAMGGNLRFESQADKGTAFQLLFPDCLPDKKEPIHD